MADTMMIEKDQEVLELPVEIDYWLAEFDPRTPEERELDDLAEYIEQQLEDARLDYGGI